MNNRKQDEASESVAKGDNALFFVKDPGRKPPSRTTYAPCPPAFRKHSFGCLSEERSRCVVIVSGVNYVVMKFSEGSTPKKKVLSVCVCAVCILSYASDAAAESLPLKSFRVQLAKPTHLGQRKERNF